ncbi:MAG: type II secretion system protein [Candidatus Paceibacterota bacterium]
MVIKILKFKIKNNNKTEARPKLVCGFTLIEVMVSVGLFAIVVLISMTAILSIIDANKKAQALNDVINNMNFSIESMVRDLRTGYNYTCGSTVASNPISGCPPTAVSSVTFYSSISNCDITYSWDGKTISKDESTCVGGGGNQALTSKNITVGKFDLFITNTSAASRQQPLILMILKATGKVGKQSTEFDLQTLISQRRLNIQ